MENTLYEAFHETSPLGISFAWFTNSGGHHPLHWHDEVEILFPLSGEADIVIDGSRHNLLKRHLLVVESGQVHSSHSESGNAMFLCIHFSKASLKYYLPNPDKPEKLFLFSTPCVILKKKGVFICYSLINTLIKFMASLPVMTA